MARSIKPRKVKHVNTYLRKKKNGKSYYVAVAKVPGFKTKSFKETDYETLSAMMDAAEKYVSTILVHGGEQKKSPKEKHTLNEVMGCVEIPLKDQAGKLLYDAAGNQRMRIIFQENNLFAQQYSDLTDSTRDFFYYKYSHYIYPSYGNDYVEDITDVMIENNLKSAVNDLNQKGITQLFLLWKKIMHVAVKQRWIAGRDNPVQDIDNSDLPKVNKLASASRRKGTLPERRMVTDEDLKKVINEVQKGSSRNYGKEMTAYNRHVIAVALVIERELGLQPAEAFALRADDLDVMRDKNGEITSSILHIKRTIHRDKGNRITLRFTKTDTRERPLPIRKELTETLIEMIKISEQRKPNPNNPPLYDDWNAYFMTKYDGKFFSVGKVGEYISGCAKRVGVSFDMYSSRHQVSNDLGPGSNTNQKTVMSIMGHSEYSTSLGYMEPTQEQLAAAMERVSKTDYTKMLNKNTQDTDAGGSQTTDSK